MTLNFIIILDIKGNLVKLLQLEGLLASEKVPLDGKGEGKGKGAFTFQLIKCYY